MFSFENFRQGAGEVSNNDDILFFLKKFKRFCVGAKKKKKNVEANLCLVPALLAEGFYLPSG